jgi:hypothetical protein
MTDREKAIIYFKDMRKRFCEDYLNICPKHSIAYKATLAEKYFYDTAIEAIQQETCGDCISREAVENAIKYAEINFTVNSDIDFTKHKREVQEIVNGIVDAQIKALRDLPSVTPQQKPNIKALGEDIRICQKSITDKKVLIGFNMAVALCNKHLAESEVQDADRD